MKNSTLKFGLRAVVVIAAFVAAALIAALGVSKRAFAEDKNTVDLSPVEIESDINYHLFDAPTCVYADASGLLIAERNAVKSVSADGAVETVRADVAADKVCRTGNYLITLENGVIHSYYGSDSAVYDAYEAVDIEIDGSTLYALTADGYVTMPLGETSFDADQAVFTRFSSSQYPRIEASNFTVSNGKIFVAVDSAIFKNKQDIVAVNTDEGTGTVGGLISVFMQSDRILSMTAMDYSNTLYTVTGDGVYGYTLGTRPALAFSSHQAAATDIFAFDGFVYALDTLDGLKKLSADLSVVNSVIASASDADGFFDMPMGVALKNSTLYVADAVNDRIAEYGATVKYVDGTQFDAPVSVACDSTGALYVAHAFNEIVKLTSSGNTVVTVDGMIKQIAVNADKTLFVLTHNGLWLYDGTGDGAVKVGDTAYKAITLAAGRDELYALLDGGAVKKIAIEDGKVKETAYCSVDSSAFSIAVDLSGSVFALSATHITRTSANNVSTVEFAMTDDGNPYELGFSSGTIALATVGNDFVKYGDAVVVDTYKHRVFTANGATLGVKLIDDDYRVPPLKDDTSPDNHDSGLIRTALYDTQVFSLPMETPPVYTIAKGRKVIVAQYDLEDSREYSLILIDNLSTGELLQGYVYRDSLSEPLSYSAPPASSGTVYASATPVYKWPSPNSNAIYGFGAVERATQFDMLDFVHEYRDDYNNLWYRIRILDKYEGYILAANISVLGYDPIFIRPAYDAEIISFEGSSFAQAYELVDGEYKEIDMTFKTGTQVEVVGTFDSSVEYTQIKYLDPEYGTLTCYVRTEYLKYKGVNIVLIVAIVVASITLVLAAIIIVRVVYLKKKRLTTT